MKHLSTVPPAQHIALHDRFTRPRIAALGASLSALIFLGDLAVPLGVSAGVPYIIPVILALWSPTRQDVFLSALLGTGLTILGYFLSPPPPTDGLFWTVIANRLLSLGAIWSMAAAVFLYHRSREKVAEVRRRLQVSEDKRREQLALARLGQMAAIVAHEVKNPLAGMKSVLQVLQSRMESEKDREIMAQMCLRVDSLTDSLEDMLVYARPTKLDTTNIEVQTFLKAHIARFHEDPISDEMDVVLEADPGQASADSKLLGEALLNLLLNAAQAMEGRGKVEVSSELSDDTWTIHVDDNGPPVPDEVLNRVFEPFFTTRTRGTGLGLAIVQQTVERHGGRVSIGRRPDKGTRVTLTVPTLHMA